MPANLPRLPLLVVVPCLVAAALGAGCGRTSLDDGLIPIGGVAGATGAGGQSGTGTGGRGAGGGTGTDVLCGATICRADTQACCVRQVGGQPSQSCVAASDPTACQDGLAVGCASPTACPASQVCCFAVFMQSISCQSMTACASGFSFSLCAGNNDCPASTTCCLQAPGLGACLPAGFPCVPPR